MLFALIILASALSPALAAVLAGRNDVSTWLETKLPRIAGRQEARLAYARGTLGHSMGEPEATEGLTALAKYMGASRTSAGRLGQFTKNLSGDYGRVPAPRESLPDRVEIINAHSNVNKAKTVKIRYGPYKIPGMNTKNSLGEMGMLSSYPDKNISKPGEGSCSILAMEAGLEFMNRSNANINSGLWLHHMVMLNIGPDREDPTCADRDISLPHVTVGSRPRGFERIYASGNERTRADFTKWTNGEAGYKLKPVDQFAAIVELMNENSYATTVYLTMTYEYVDGHPFRDDVKWDATLEGQIIGVIAHLHDGGVGMQISRDGAQVCNSTSRYGTSPEYLGRPQSTAGGHSHGTPNLQHISEQPVCYESTIEQAAMKTGQRWDLRAHYDFGMYHGNMHKDGEFDEVMAISLIYVRKK